MQRVRWIFRIAAIYGLLVLLPGLFMEARFSIANPPALTHPEFYYGFYGSAIVWQLVFLLIASDPARYRALIGLAVLEKAAFFFPSVWLWQSGHLAASDPLWGALVDGLLMLMFGYAWWHSRRIGNGINSDSDPA